MFNLKSIGKAFKEVGVTVASAAVVCGLAALEEPGVLAPVAAAFGPFALLAIPALQFGIKYLSDAYKHRNDPPLPPV